MNCQTNQFPLPPDQSGRHSQPVARQTVPSRLKAEDATSDHQRLVFQMANLAAGMFREAGWSFTVLCSPVRLVTCGDSAKSGLLAAAVEIRDLLCQSPEGRQACADLGFELVEQERASSHV